MLVKTETKVGIFILVALSILFYMSFYLGVFRFDRSAYNNYIVFFNDISGLEKKGDVKIAGVKVGWIDKLELVDGAYRAKVIIMISRSYELRKNAYAVIRQEGLLGTKYLEIIPGDPHMPILSPDEALSKPGRSPASVDDIIHNVQDISVNMEEVSTALQDAFAGYRGRQQIKEMVDNLHQASERIAAFTSSLDKTFVQNEQTITSALTDFRELAPVLRTNVDRMTDILDRDFYRVATSIEESTQTFEKAAKEARDGFKNISSVVEKVNQGEGFIGKLIHDEDMYRDFSRAVRGVKNYIGRVETLGIVFDSHGEFMVRRAENMEFKDTKGYFDIRIHPSEDYFLVAQAVYTQKGSINRSIVDSFWFDENGVPIPTSEVVAKRLFTPEPIGRYERRERKLDQYKVGIQFGKIFRDIALRTGVFENTAGMAIDVDIPFGTDKFRWVTSFEVFDFRGRNRFNDARPHFKWINRVFVLDSLYMAFGADDFISRNNANAFFGGGIRFCDDDIKYIASKLGFAGLGN